MSAHDPIAYTYDADTHCPGCALERFGRDARGDIAGEGTLDSEGNEPGAIAPWDEWQSFTGEPETLACGTCGGTIDEYVPDDYVYPYDESDARLTASEWHGGQASPLYAFSSSGTILADAVSEARHCLAYESEHCNDRERNELARLVEYLEAHPPQTETLPL